MAQKKSHYSKKKISLSGSPKSATEEGPDPGTPDRQSENKGMKKTQKVRKKTLKKLPRLLIVLDIN